MRIAGRITQFFCLPFFPGRQPSPGRKPSGNSLPFPFLFPPAVHKKQAESILSACHLFALMPCPCFPGRQRGCSRLCAAACSGPSFRAAAGPGGNCTILLRHQAFFVFPARHGFFRRRAGNSFFILPGLLLPQAHLPQEFLPRALPAQGLLPSRFHRPHREQALPGRSG